MVHGEVNCAAETRVQRMRHFCSPTDEFWGKYVTVTFSALFGFNQRRIKQTQHEFA